MNQIAKKSALLPSMNSLVEDFFTKDLFDWTNKNFATVGSTLPSVNIKETEKEIKIDLAAPGLKKEDFEVHLRNHVLSISAEHQEEKEEKNKDNDFMRKEFNYKSFCRSFNLPDSANDDKIDATYKDGILRIVVGKKQTDSPKSTKTIAIK